MAAEDSLVPSRSESSLSLSSQAAVVALQEAWEEARLDHLPPERIGLIIGGSNLQQRETLRTHTDYEDRLAFIRPTFGFAFMDSDLCGVCTELFAIRGLACTVGGASASGQLAILGAMLAGSVTLAPFAIAAALRVSVN